MSLDNLPPGVDLCTIPLEVRADGLPPNFDDPVSLQATAIAITVVCVTLAVLVFSGRFFTNRRNLKAADYVMLVALIFDLAIAGVILASSKYFRHSWDTPLCWVNQTSLKFILVVVVVIVVGPALVLPKASIFLFYLQIFSINKSVKVGSKIGLVATVLGYVPASLLLLYFITPHIGETWAELAASGRARRGFPVSISIGVASVIVDIYIFVLPLPALFKLQLPTSKKIQLIALFGTAMIGIVASVLCLIYRIKLIDQGDSFWKSANVDIAVVVENNVAIIVGSLPAFASFIRQYVVDSSLVKSLKSSLTARSTTNSSAAHADLGSASSWTMRPFGPTGAKKAPYNKLLNDGDAGIQTLVTGTRAGEREQPEQAGIVRQVGFSLQEQWQRLENQREAV